MSARALSNRLNQLVNGELQRLLEDSLTEIEDFMLDLNREQLSDGKDTKGKGFGNYSEATLIAKEDAGRPARTSYIVLHDKGDFYRSLVVNIVNNNLIFDATDWKLSMLEQDYGIDILGVSEEDKPKVVSKMYDILSIKLKTFFNV